MKITIDTKEDSPEEIRKIIRMLSLLAQDSTHPGIQMESTGSSISPDTQEGLFGMFSGNDEKKEYTEEIKPEKTDEEITEKRKKDFIESRVIPY